jgi:hypothetical protein
LTSIGGTRKIEYYSIRDPGVIFENPNTAKPDLTDPFKQDRILIAEPEIDWKPKQLAIWVDNFPNHSPLTLKVSLGTYEVSAASFSTVTLSPKGLSCNLAEFTPINDFNCRPVILKGKIIEAGSPTTFSYGIFMKHSGEFMMTTGANPEKMYYGSLSLDIPNKKLLFANANKCDCTSSDILNNGTEKISCSV